MAPISLFLEYLRQHVTFSPEEEQQLQQLLIVKQYSKGSLLLEEGKVSGAFYFLLRGCVRMYYLVDGIEKNTFFYTENQFISSYESFVRSKPAHHFISCLEDTDVVLISQESAYRLLDYSAKFEQLSRILMEQELIIYQQMLASFVTQNAEQRYQSFVENRPDLVQRIPLYHLASYLGVNPETLSRIRARIGRSSLS